MDSKLKVQEVIVGSILLESRIVETAIRFIDVDDFSEGNTKEVYEAIISLYKRGKFIDLLSVTDEVKNVSPVVLTDYMGMVGSVTNFDKHCLHLKELSIKDKLVGVGSDLMVDAQSSDIFETAEKYIRILNEIIPNFHNGVVDMEALQMELDVRMNENNEGLKGLLTGMDDYDRFSNGLQKGDLTIIAGETSQGKTSLALSWVYNQIMNDKRVAFYSYEMSSIQIAARIHSIASKVSSKDILMKKLNEGQFNDVMSAFTKLMNKNLYIVETKNSSYSWLENSIKNIKKQYQIDCVYVDYLQLVTQGNLSRKDSASLTANGLKRLAKSSDVNIPITALSQLARDKTNPRPELSRLKESGDIENAADTVIGIWRPEHYGAEEMFADNTDGNISPSGLGLLRVMKGRNIGLMNIAVRWTPEITYYSNFVNQNPF